MGFDAGVLLTTLGMVLLMEMGDKTQLLVMCCASKYKPGQVLIGVSLAVLVLNILAVLLGAAIGGIRVIQDTVKVVASLLFIFFGLLNLKESKDDEETSCSAANAITTVALAFFLAEFGDKTQLSTFSFAALYPNNPVSVFIGSTIGLIVADSIGLIAGAVALKFIPKRVLAYVSAVLFIAFGLMNGWTTLREHFGFDIQTTMLITGSAALLSALIAAVMLIAQQKKSRY